MSEDRFSFVGPVKSVTIHDEAAEDVPVLSTSVLGLTDLEGKVVSGIALVFVTSDKDVVVANTELYNLGVGKVAHSSFLIESISRQVGNEFGLTLESSVVEGC